MEKKWKKWIENNLWFWKLICWIALFVTVIGAVVCFRSGGMLVLDWDEF